jgi:adenylylsulfate kinase-like enzyme/SAM-dependent methyltransferase
VVPVGFIIRVIAMPTLTVIKTPRHKLGTSLMSNMIPPSSPDRTGIIWITGYSGSGKTTVGRIVERELQQRQLRAIFLDGDDLRNIFAEKWGYVRSERIELARVYFRLCNYLASQGFIVILAAVAMYEEVRTWIRANSPNALEIYLDVPEEERIRRDRLTKNVYSRLGSLNKLYDEPQNPDLRIASFGDVSPDIAAQRVVEHFFLVGAKDTVNKGKRDHWEEFYRKGVGEKAPSLFAQHVAEHLRGDERLLEIGCGNGRDAAFFQEQGLHVVAIDASPAAIDVCLKLHGADGVRFAVGKLDDEGLELGPSFDVVYCRFVLHAMTEVEQARMLLAAHRMLRTEGSIYLECRSINDPLARQGEVISPTERIHGHYRRFIIYDELIQQLQATGFTIENAIESTGLAPYKDEDPVVIRVTASKSDQSNSTAA